MKLSSPQSSSSPTLRLLGVTLLTLAASAGCGDDEAPPAPQPDFGISVLALDGASPEEPVTLRCDGTLAVRVELSTSIEKSAFTLSPAAACGESKRCGYVRIQGLAADDAVLSQVDSVTTEGVLELASDERPLLSHIRVGLIRGLDQAPVVNKDGAEVTSDLSPSFSLEMDCDAAPSMGGQGGQGGGAGAGGLGGAGGAAGADASGAGGAAGADASGGAGLGGAPSDGGAAGLGGQQP